MTYVLPTASSEIWTVPGWGLVAAALAVAAIVGSAFLVLVVVSSWRSRVRKSKYIKPSGPL